MDDIERAFADVTVGDFDRATSAVWRQRFADLPADTRRQIEVRGAVSFDDWVEVMLRFTREGAASSVGFHSFAMIHSPEEQRRFVLDEDDTPPSFAARLGRESRAMGGSWLFVAVESQGRVFSGDQQPPPIDSSDPSQIERALESGVLQAGICWVASFREAGISIDRGGIMYTDPEGLITSEDEGELDTSTNLFQNVLEAQ